MSEITPIKKTKSSNTNLQKANKEKNDEFYTQLPDIEKELGHYKDHLKGKIVFCNCDDPEESHFWGYFAANFEYLGLKKLISTHFEREKPSYKLEIMHDINNDGKINKLDTIKTPLTQNGDFRSPECIEILKSCDIVVTNPPFSLFREYVAQLIEYDKKFVIIGNQNAITYKETFKLIKDNKLWLGHGFNGGNAFFKTPHYKDFASGVYNEETGLVKFRNVVWFTNLDFKKRHEDLILYKTYYGNEVDYPNYDNYDAFNVNKVADIPGDYTGAMGVPITFLDKYNPGQFEILGITDRENLSGLKTKTYSILDVPNHGDLNRRAAIKVGSNYKSTYVRLLIKNKKL
jgi:Adenine-specific methyltransferase EcoRI